MPKPPSPPESPPSRSKQPRPVSPSLARLFVGTSGWAYPTWKPGFYPPRTPARQFLSAYSAALTGVEVNYTFRTLPTPELLATWLAATPSTFRFSFKAPQRITHHRRLLHCEDDITHFVECLAPVRDAGRLGTLLFQLPPNFQASRESKGTIARLSALLAHPALTSHLVSLEFRHPSWLEDPLLDLLREHNAALCIALDGGTTGKGVTGDDDTLTIPEIHTSTTHTTYRLRRTGGYSRPRLKGFAQRFLALAADPVTPREVYVALRHEDEPTGPLNAQAILRYAQTLAARS